MSKQLYVDLKICKDELEHNAKHTDYINQRLEHDLAIKLLQEIKQPTVVFKPVDTIEQDEAWPAVFKRKTVSTITLQALLIELEHAGVIRIQDKPMHILIDRIDEYYNGGKKE